MIVRLASLLFYMGLCTPVHGAMHPGTWGYAEGSETRNYINLRRFRINGKERYCSPAPALRWGYGPGLRFEGAGTRVRRRLITRSPHAWEVASSCGTGGGNLVTMERTRQLVCAMSVYVRPVTHETASPMVRANAIPGLGIPRAADGDAKTRASVTTGFTLWHDLRCTFVGASALAPRMEQRYRRRSEPSFRPRRCGHPLRVSCFPRIGGLSAPQWGQAGSPDWTTPLHEEQVTGSTAHLGSFRPLLASPSRAATSTPIGPSKRPRTKPVPARFFELATAAPRKPHTAKPKQSHELSMIRLQWCRWEPTTTPPRLTCAPPACCHRRDGR